MAEPITLRLHRSLYRPDSVRAAAERFARLAEIEVAEEGDRIHVTLLPRDERVRARLADEFGNHALFQTIVDVRAAEGGLAGA